ncbi:hypothetical protein MESS4_20035 [Mesorhizobium sp. STM 4661]|nr:hypothetical protein MESS4_20035 [Mesorhizobium sp. STM 4661]
MHPAELPRIGRTAVKIALAVEFKNAHLQTSFHQLLRAEPSAPEHSCFQSQFWAWTNQLHCTVLLSRLPRIGAANLVRHQEAAYRVEYVAKSPYEFERRVTVMLPSALMRMTSYVCQRKWLVNEAYQPGVPILSTGNC